MLPFPSYWLPHPPFELTPALEQSFAALLHASIASGGQIEYRLPAPRWQFLCYAVERAGYVLHGSQNADIPRFEPRQPSDLRAFGAQLAVYAAADGIWPMFFAILDRQRFPTTMMNGCIQLEDAAGARSPRLYFFSVGDHVLHQSPWSVGTVYILPPESFAAETQVDAFGGKLHIFQLASLEPVSPLAHLSVSPHDFPFLNRVRAHKEARLEEYAHALNQGLPWPD